MTTSPRWRGLWVGLAVGLGSWAPAGAQAPLGWDFALNQTVAGTQQFPNPAAQPDGGFVVAWDQTIADVDLTAITAVLLRSFDGVGAPGSDEVAVRGPARASFQGARVAVAPDGARLVTWQEPGGPDGRSEALAALWGPDGGLLVDGLSLSDGTPGDQAVTGIAGLAPGGYVATAWSMPLPGEIGEDGSGSGVFVHRLTAAGELAGPSLRANTFTPGLQAPGDVAAAADSRFVVVWTSVGQDGSAGGVYGQRFAADGSRLGGEFRVNQVTTSWQQLPDVAMSLDGRFVVVWESDGQDGSEAGVFARRYGRDGQPRGNEFQVNTNTFAWQERPKVAMDAAGNFVVVWVDWFSGVELPDIIGRAFLADGQPAGPEFRVNSRTRNDQDDPDLAMLGDGSLVAVWETFNGEDWDLAGRRFAIPFPSTCRPSDHVLCLRDGRFRVEVDWQLPAGQGTARAQALTADTGAFSFFGEDNLELLVKVLDACGSDGHFWVFAGGLTNVLADLTVVDTATGAIRTYRNPPRTAFRPVQDTSAFATCEAVFEPLLAPASAGSTAPLGSGRAGACRADDTHLCLQAGRYEVAATWTTPNGQQGAAQARPLTAASGAFWFFAPDNLELLIKVLDGCGVNGRRWVFAAGLTNVGVELTVRDTATGAVRTYAKPPRSPFQPLQDTAAFAACP